MLRYLTLRRKHKLKKIAVQLAAYSKVQITRIKNSTIHAKLGKQR
ncbi:hypothetical protein [Sulfolobus sp. E11-6]|nr:hypothetical protein [Sulfolobus sp. E11-6]